METNPTNDPFSGLAGLYALGALNADERKDFETHIETCQNCVNEVMKLLPVSHALTRAVPYHEPSVQLIEKTQQFCKASGSTFILTNSIENIGKQDVIYTDTWVSMGDEDASKKSALLTKFAPYQVNHQLMAKTQANIVLHCQPAHLEEEITTELFDSPLSKVFQQAENRMWAQNAVLVSLFSQ